MAKPLKNLTLFSSGPEATGSSGIDLHANKDGLRIGGWFDGFVGINAGSGDDGCWHLSWEEIDEIRKKVGG